MIWLSVRMRDAAFSWVGIEVETTDAVLYDSFWLNWLNGTNGTAAFFKPRPWQRKRRVIRPEGGRTGKWT